MDSPYVFDPSPEPDKNERGMLHRAAQMLLDWLFRDKFARLIRSLSTIKLPPQDTDGNPRAGR